MYPPKLVFLSVKLTSVYIGYTTNSETMTYYIEALCTTALLWYLSYTTNGYYWCLVKKLGRLIQFQSVFYLALSIP